MRLLRLTRRTTQAPKSAAPVARKSRGQSTIEFALMLQLLIVLLGIVLEGGLAFNAWIRVNTAARDGTRFALDAGRPSDLSTLVIKKLEGLDVSQVAVHLIKGRTDANGFIPPNPPVGTPYWSINTVTGTGTPRITRSVIEGRLRAQGNPRNIEFTIVEVNYKYTPLAISLVTGGNQIPMSSYAIVEQYPQ